MNVHEMIKIARSLEEENVDSQPNIEFQQISLFSESKSDKFIIESKNERKNINIKQIINTLESLVDNFLDKDMNLTKSSSSFSTSSSTDKKSSQNVLRSALGVFFRRPWLSELKIEDMFKLDPISVDEFVLNYDANTHVTIDAV